jgi:hypothetical protein
MQELLPRSVMPPVCTGDPAEGDLNGRNSHGQQSHL